LKTKFWQSRNFWQFKNPSYNNLDTFKSLFLTWYQTRHSILKVSKPKSQQLRNSWQLQNQVLIEPWYLKVSIFDMVSIKISIFTISTFKSQSKVSILTISTSKSQQSRISLQCQYPSLNSHITLKSQFLAWSWSLVSILTISKPMIWQLRNL
jgi:hypothetical protein